MSGKKLFSYRNITKNKMSHNKICITKKKTFADKITFEPIISIALKEWVTLNYSI